MNIKKYQCYIHSSSSFMSTTQNTYASSEYEYEYESACDIDFFNELKQMKCSAASAATTPATTPANDIPRCLITDDPLRKDHITLRCGHKFNYVPLFKEVLFQKCSLMPKNLAASIITMYTKNTPVTGTSTSSNIISVTYNSSLNLETRKLQYNEIKCPYCRTITHNILPYYPYPEVCKVKYVNMPPNLALPGLSCEYHHHHHLPAKGRRSETTTSTGDEESTGSTCKNGCIYIEKYDMMLCNKHLNKKDTEQNVIVSHHNPATTVCQFLLLSGARKGTPCGKPIWIPKTAQAASESKPCCKAHWGK